MPGFIPPAFRPVFLGIDLAAASTFRWVERDSGNGVAGNPAHWESPFGFLP